MSTIVENIQVRPISPLDGAALVTLHEGLSPEDQYFRFFGSHPHLSTFEIAHFTIVDGSYRVALVIELDDKVVAVGSYDGAPGSDQAEVAFVVADGYRRHGFATLLLDRLAQAAAQHGIDYFTADVLAANHAMRAVFHDSGFNVHSKFGRFGVTHFRFSTTKEGGDNALP